MPATGNKPCFNPRAREGRDPAGGRVEAPSPSFNPRAREGRDNLRAIEVRRMEVSIHAPARGATCVTCEMHMITRCFNPRAREGRDEIVCTGVIPDQSFNPRAREGRDGNRSASIT